MITKEQEIMNEIQEIINSQVNEVNFDYYVAIRDVYKIPYITPEFQNIKYIICRCITLGLYIPAMTLLNHLLEKFTKFALIYNDNKKQKKDINKPFQLVDELEKNNSKFNGKNLYQNIVELHSEKLINGEQKQILLRMKDDYRNAYSHSDREKMYGDTTVGITEIHGIEAIEKFLDGKEDDLPKRQEKLVNLNFADFKFINVFAGKDCIPYLTKLDGIVRDVESKLYDKKNE